MLGLGMGPILLVTFLGLLRVLSAGVSSFPDSGEPSRSKKLSINIPRLREVDNEAGSNVVSPLVKNNGGPCSVATVTVQVRTESDFFKRAKYPPSQTVLVVLLNNITVTAPVNFSSSWSCTLVRSSPSTKQFTITASNYTFPAVLVWATSYIFFYGVNFHVPIPYSASAALPCVNFTTHLKDYNTLDPCGALVIWGSYEIKAFQGYSYGRVDILRSSRVHIDGMNIYNPGDQLAFHADTNVGCIRVARCGDPYNLVRANILITNNDISGGLTGVFIARTSLGVTVRNNDIHNFTFTGLQCGFGVSNSADCMFTTFAYNFIYYESFVPYGGDSSGIYFDTHWTNPGNYLTCNYVVGGYQCLYLDYASSGVVVDGHVCSGVSIGLKLNTGKSNILKSVVMHNIYYTVSSFKCQNPDVNNCDSSTSGYLWANPFETTFSTPAWKELAPYLPNLCNETTVDGLPCNTPPLGGNATLTGRCSGLPTRNDFTYIIVDGAAINQPRYDSTCDRWTNTPKYNSMRGIDVSSDTAQFNDVSSLDFGVSNPKSPVYQQVPDFKSCPRSRVGIQAPLSLAAQMATFNLATPKRSRRIVAKGSGFFEQYSAKVRDGPQPRIRAQAW